MRLMCVLVVLSSAVASAQFTVTQEQRDAWSEPAEPFRVIGNIYYVGYVGSKALSSYLIMGHA